jgi:hypothetical protein
LLAFVGKGSAETILVNRSERLIQTTSTCRPGSPIPGSCGEAFLTMKVLNRTNLPPGLPDARHPAGAQVRAKSLRERIFLHFSQKAMVEGVLAGYRDTLADR